MQRRPEVVLWGAGMVAGVHAAACRSLGWRVSAVVSRSAERASALAGTIGARAYTCEEAAGRRLGDIAIVATPPSSHVDDATTLLGSGHHVVVEAPIACNLVDADRLIAAEEMASGSVMYSEHLVASPVVDALLTDIRSLGALTHVSARAIQPPPTWRAGEQWGGGALFDLGVHPVGLVVRTGSEAGAGAPTSVTAVITDAGSDREHATVKLRFGSGLVATIVVGWRPGATPDSDLQASSASGVLRAELHPSPTLERNGDRVRTGSGASPADPSLVDDYGYAPQLKRFWTNIRTGRPVPATARLGREVLDIVMGAHWSAAREAEDTPLPFAGPRDRTPSQLLDT